MKISGIILTIFLMLFGGSKSSFASTVQDDVVSEYKVSGKCERCKRSIEQAADLKGVSRSDWNITTQVLSVTYDKKKTSADLILKSVAYAGFDNEKYLAPDRAYAKLPDCCRYERIAIVRSGSETHRDHEEMSKELQSGNVQDDHEHGHHKPVEKDESVDPAQRSGEEAAKPQGKTDHSRHQVPKEGRGIKHNADHGVKKNSASVSEEKDILRNVYSIYFDLKDALVKENSSLAAAKGKSFAEALNAVRMDALSKKSHDAFMKYMPALSSNAKAIAASKNIDKQRTHFSSLSDSLYELMKVIRPGYPVYLENCPMYNDGKGADWISRESQIKNPYYGSKMLTCGKVKETLK